MHEHAFLHALDFNAHLSRALWPLFKLRILLPFSNSQAGIEAGFLGKEGGLYMSTPFSMCTSPAPCGPFSNRESSLFSFRIRRRVLKRIASERRAMHEHAFLHALDLNTHLSRPLRPLFKTVNPHFSFQNRRRALKQGF